MPILTALWGTPSRRITTACTMVAAVCGAIVGIPPAWTAVGLPEVATRVFVHEQVDPVRLAQADTTRAVYQLTLSNLESSLYAAQQDQQKAPSQTVDQRVQELKSEIDRVQSKINNIK